MIDDSTNTTTPEKGKVVVRKATAADGATVIRMVIALADYEKLAAPDDDARARLLADAFGARPRFEIFLAEYEDQVVGYAFTFETYSTFLARPTLYLEDLFVLPEFRGIGAGYALMRECARQALARGCGRFEWSVLDWNTPSISFYERLGAHHLSDWLVYRLDGEDLQRLGSA